MDCEDSLDVLKDIEKNVSRLGAEFELSTDHYDKTLDRLQQQQSVILSHQDKLHTRLSDLEAMVTGKGKPRVFPCDNCSGSGRSVFFEQMDRRLCYECMREATS
jgi:hypothetical protein